MDSGIQTTLTPETLLAAPQVVYLDFDGAVASYRNRDLDITIDNIMVEDSGFDAPTISAIVATLNEQFGEDIVFTSELPEEEQYSTIYIGVTSAFDEFGSFLGLAETVDSGNLIRDDNAFVLLNSAAATELVTSVIAHEVQHLVGTLDHGGEALARYAVTSVVSRGQMVSGESLSSGVTMYVRSGGTALSTTLNSGGSLYVSAGGTALSTTLNSGVVLYVSSGRTANATTLNSRGWLRVSSGGTALATRITFDGNLAVASGGTAFSTTVSSGGSLFVFSGCTALSTTVNIVGSLHVSSGGTAVSTTVSSGGYLYVSSGGTATGINALNGAHLYLTVAPDTYIAGQSNGSSFATQNGRA